MSEDLTLKIWLLEYDKLKAEQTQRIGFRDNLLYVTLGLIAVIIPTAISNPTNCPALLTIPWFTLILGWTYLNNDQKISAIGHHIRHTLTPNIQQKINSQPLVPLFTWETAHRNDTHRKRRKLIQLFIDQLTFTLSGLLAILTHFLLSPKAHPALYLLGTIELLLLLALSREITHYADLKPTPPPQP
jgi:hypothetical protein